MVLRHSGRVGSRRFTELLRNNQVPEEFFCYVRPVNSPGNRNRQAFKPALIESGDNYSFFMQVISLSTSSSVVSKEVTSLISPMASFQK